MNIAVLIKSVIATDEPIIVRNGKIDEDGVKKVINPYDEYGLEEALRIKEDDGSSVTVISAGDEKTVEALRTALAMGADEAWWIRTEGAGDEHVLSLALAETVRRGGFDLVFAGHLSIDNGAGQVAIRVAELLGWPHAGAIVACRVDRNGEDNARKIGQGYTLHVTRDAEGDSENWELPLPALLTAQQGLNEPRYPALAGIMKAKRKPLTELSFDELLAESEARTLAARGVGGGTAGRVGDADGVGSGQMGYSERVSSERIGEPEIEKASRARDGEPEVALDGAAVAGPRTERLGCEAPPPRPAGRKLDGTVGEQAAELIALLRNEARILKAR
ncbi:electron transfer flavoprotein subunit beta/FixA family protein [Cohnella herbarum]|uniref:Electron transfer flavoprotein subunit beta n=1 Tax=Cohnella herbarum TaxID=2728023 RepID=A0A7Z2ZNY0_9BACL|nr:electron transfer flavoprotein subunit beta/FixA family protein [Cohnella herbarum]QJD86753.1 electron transfer flavoprotein subunit beta/FixA family protein [Cohnella herbarum]